MIRLVDDQHSRVGEFVCDRAGGTFLGGSCIGVEKNGNLVGGVIYDNYNGASVCMHVAGDNKYWMTRTFLAYAFWYPFVQLKVNKVLAITGSKNPALSFHKNIGFIEECRITGAHQDGALVILTMSRHQCRFLELRYNGKVRSAAST